MEETRERDFELVAKAAALIDAVGRAPADSYIGLLQSDVLIKAILDAAPGYIYAKDRQGRMLLANAAVLELIGKPWSAVAGRTDEDFLDDRSQGRTIMDTDQRVMAAGSTQEVEELLSVGDSPPRLMMSTKTPLRDEKGEVVGIVGVPQDITERKRSRLALEAFTATLEARVAERTRERDRTWQLSQELLLVMDHDSLFEAVNPAWTSLLGWSEAELIGQQFIDWVHADDRQATRAEIAGVVQGARPFRFQNRLRHRNGGYRVLSWTAVPEAGRIYATGRDITEEIEAQELVARVEAKLHHAQKMDAIGQLTGGIAHDFNNMLQGITASLELLKMRAASGKAQEVDSLASTAIETAERAARLTHRLLAFARRQALVPKPVEPDQLVEGMAELIRRTVGPHIEVKLNEHDGVWRVLCDSNQLESALLNLAINARDAMAAGGMLTIRTDDVHLEADDLQGADGAKAGDYVTLAVSDTGSGMTEEVLAHAFEPFFTTKRGGQGSGLGLSQVYGFVHQSGGFVQLESELGRGTTVRLFLPRHAGEVPELTNASMPKKKKPAKETILVVDDEAAIRSVVAEVLSDLGYTVLEAADGDSALKIIEGQNTLDLLVSDIGLPGVNGRQLANVARSRNAELPVLLITGYAGMALEDWNLAQGMRLMHKPFGLTALLATINQLLGHED